MRRPHLVLILTFIIGLILAACASPAGSPGASSGGEPSTAASEAPAASDGGGGGGGGGIGTTLNDGAWSGGEAHVSMSGDASGTVDASLQPTISFTDGGSTTLIYVDADSGSSVAVSVTSGDFAASVTTAEMVAGGGTTTNCTVNYHSTDDNNISGDFSCPDSPAVTATGVVEGAVDFEGSFSATR